MLKYKTMVGATGFETALLRLRVKSYKTVKFLNYFLRCETSTSQTFGGRKEKKTCTFELGNSAVEFFIC